mmetsp:Transcript_16864/g.23467  ORF Transcript_16864/g.23467 Transcript_16864/m.23467 type:complete len:111 (-) Transcript_16864:3225-3557(-)
MLGTSLLNAFPLGSSVSLFFACGSFFTNSLICSSTSATSAAENIPPILKRCLEQNKIQKSDRGSGAKIVFENYSNSELINQVTTKLILDIVDHWVDSRHIGVPLLNTTLV